MGVFDFGFCVDLGFVLFINDGACFVPVFVCGAGIGCSVPAFIEAPSGSLLASAVFVSIFFEGVPRATISVYKLFVFGRWMLVG